MRRIRVASRLLNQVFAVVAVDTLRPLSPEKKNDDAQRPFGWDAAVVVDMDDEEFM